MSRIADVDIRLLRIFKAVVEAGGFSAAQTVLNTSTSTISLHMTELEKRLGFSLCRRGRGGFTLTDRGFLVYQRAKKLLYTLDDQFANMHSLRKQLTGKVRIGVVDSLITHPQAPLIRALQKFNSFENEVELQLLVDERSELERRVLTHDLHAAISPYVRPVSGLEFHLLLLEHHKLYCGAGHPLFGRTTQVDSSITDYPFVLRSHHGPAEEERFTEMHVRATANNMEAMLTLLLTGQYIGLLPDHLAESYVAEDRLWQLQAPEIEQVSRHSLVVPHKLDISTATATLIPLILAEVGQNLDPAD